MPAAAEPRDSVFAKAEPALRYHMDEAGVSAETQKKIYGILHNVEITFLEPLFDSFGICHKTTKNFKWRNQRSKTEIFSDLKT